MSGFISIAHNDIKPNNIAVERGRNEADLIPIVIDLVKLLQYYTVLEECLEVLE